jgi:hypothetical protein
MPGITAAVPKIGSVLKALVDWILMRDKEAAYNEGAIAAEFGIEKNPHRPKTRLHRSWQDGHDSVKYHDERSW